MEVPVRLIARFSLVVLAAALMVGPLSAAAIPLSHGVHVSAPAEPTPSSPLGGLLAYLGGGLVIGLTIKKDIGSIAQKFVTRAQAAAGDYKTGVSNAGGTWEQNTAAAEPQYEAGVQQSITNKKYSKGVGGKGGKYQTNAVNLGSQRYGPGVANAQSAYQTGMAPVLQVLQGVQLPAKGFRGSPQNQARSNAVATALAAWRANK
jgi:hypothetical protein